MVVLMVEFSHRSDDMEKFHAKIERAIQQDPAYDCLELLRPGVWTKIRDTRVNQGTQAWCNITLTPAIKIFSLVLILGSCLALSQVSFNKDLESDLFDLRYFSHQSLATTDLLSSNTQGILP